MTDREIDILRANDEQRSTDHLRSLIREGAEQLDRGEVVDGEEFFRQLAAEDEESTRDRAVG